MKTTEQVLRGAADRIRKHGWTRGKNVDEHGACCMFYAIRIAADFDHDLSRPAFAVLRLVTDDYAASLFNDRECESSYDAIAALEIAADLAA